MDLQISCSSSSVSCRLCTGWSAGWFSPSDGSLGCVISWKKKKKDRSWFFFPFRPQEYCWIYQSVPSVVVVVSFPTSASFSFFVKLLNLNKLSLSLKDGLFLMELAAAARGGQGIFFSGEVEGNLVKKMAWAVNYALIVHYSFLQKLGAIPTALKSSLPVEHAVVLQILCSPTTLHIFNHMILKKLFQKLNSLLPGNIRAKVAVVAEQLMKPIHSSVGTEAARIVPKVLPMFPEGHPSAEQASDFIPLRHEKDIRTHIMICCGCKKCLQ